MAMGKVLSDVNPVGGHEKAKAILHSLERTGNRLDEVMYVGDSITDVEAFDLVRRGKGVTISFNGNRYSVRSAEIACLSPHTLILTMLAKAFQRGGRDAVFEMVEHWNPDSLGRNKVDPSFFSQGFPKLYRITDENRLRIMEESEGFRKKVRGVEVGSLG
jgi:energy-converting hydrogenase A subunit R